MSVRARLVTLSGAALALPLMAVGAASAAQAATPPPVPVVPVPVVPVPVVPVPPTKALPAALDMVTPYEPQLSCDPRDKPGVAAFAACVRVAGAFAAICQLHGGGDQLKMGMDTV